MTLLALFNLLLITAALVAGFQALVAACAITCEMPNIQKLG